MSYHIGVSYSRRFSRRKIFTRLTAVLVGVVLIQLAYPPNWNLPFAKIGGVSVGLKSRQFVTKKLNMLSENAKISIETITGKRDATLKELGVSIDGKAVENMGSHYSLKQRLIPFSLFANGFLTNEELPVTYDEKQLDAFAEQLELEADQANGPSVYVEGSQVIVEDSRSGYRYDKQEIIEQLKQKGLVGSNLRLTGRVVNSQPSDSLLVAARRAQNMIDARLELKANGKTKVIFPAMIGTWLRFKPLGNGSSYAVEFDTDAIAADLEEFNREAGTPGRVITISFEKGKQVNRESGGDGKVIDYQKAAQKISNHIVTGSIGPLELPMTTLAPIIKYDKQYEHTEAGLHELLNDIVSTKAGKVAVSVRELDPRGWKSSVNGDRPYHPASTYKMYVAFAWLKTMDEGKQLWSVSITGGKSATQCFELMIVKSNNECAEAFARKLGGWREVQKTIEAARLPGVTVSPKFSATADAEVEFLARLESGSLLSEESTERLLETMAKQQYRQGIPAGAQGAVVADKVGFLNADLHDAAIVTAGDKKYAITILTTGSSWNDIADIARQIHAFLTK